MGSVAAPIASLTTAPIEEATVRIDLPTILELAGEKPNAIHLARARLAESEALEEKQIATALPTLFVGSIFVRHNGIVQDINGQFLEVTKQRLFNGVIAL